jgi:hypothetical protein
MVQKASKYMAKFYVNLYLFDDKDQEFKSLHHFYNWYQNDNTMSGIIDSEDPMKNFISTAIVKQVQK